MTQYNHKNINPGLNTGPCLYSECMFPEHQFPDHVDFPNCLILNYPNLNRAPKGCIQGPKPRGWRNTAVLRWSYCIGENDMVGIGTFGGLPGPAST